MSRRSTDLRPREKSEWSFHVRVAGLGRSRDSKQLARLGLTRAQTVGALRRRPRIYEQAQRLVGGPRERALDAAERLSDCMGVPDHADVGRPGVSLDDLKRVLVRHAIETIQSVRGAAVALDVQRSTLRRYLS